MAEWKTEETTFGALAENDTFYFWLVGGDWLAQSRASRLHRKIPLEQGGIGPVNAQELSGPYRTYCRDDVPVVKVTL